MRQKGLVDIRPGVKPGMDGSHGSVKVLIVDAHKLFAEAIRTSLEYQGMQVIGVAATGPEALELARRHCPDLVLAELDIPGEGGLFVGRRILKECPDARVVMVTGSSDTRAVREALDSGFHGYLSKGTSLTRFLSSIRSSLEGHLVISEHLAAGVMGPRTEEERDAALLSDQLTPRERQVLTLLVDGSGTSAIARRLHVSPNTVRTHIQSVLAKLHVHSRLEAAAFALRHGLVDTRTDLRHG